MVRALLGHARRRQGRGRRFAVRGTAVAGESLEARSLVRRRRQPLLRVEVRLRLRLMTRPLPPFLLVALENIRRPPRRRYAPGHQSADDEALVLLVQGRQARYADRLRDENHLGERQGLERGPGSGSGISGVDCPFQTRDGILQAR